MAIFNFLLLFLLNILSYGQIFKMGIWKDDNAIFFKLQHINESTGFFGKGLIGEGPYRFSFTPYWFVYKLFGNGSLFPYYLLIFIFYLLATFAVYKFFTKFLNNRGGLVAAFLFSCGFVASEGFFWLANAMVSDVSIIFLSLCLFFYWKYFANRKIWPYLFALLFFWASAYFTAIRSYYFIGIIILFEIIFFALKRRKEIMFLILRLLPFMFIFYHFFVYGGDSRTGLVSNIIQSVLRGQLYIFYGFLSTLANVIFPDNLTSSFFDVEIKFIKLTSVGLPYVFLTTILVSIFAIFLIFKRRKHSKLLKLSFSTILILWSIFSNQIFNVPILNLNTTTNYILYLGGVIIIFLSSVLFVINKKQIKKYLFLVGSFLISIAAYWLYEPLVVMNTTHRYLVGPFFLLTGLFAFLYLTTRKPVKVIIVIWGLFNLINSIVYQHQILLNRSFPVDSFYKTLQKDVPKITKGDVFYFNLGDSAARDYFNNAISTASMPDETSFAWRYGVDRYDFKITSNFNDFIKYIKSNNSSLNQLHTFYYTKDKLADTSTDTISFLKKGTAEKETTFTSLNENENLIAKLDKPIISLTPVELNLTMSATLPDISQINFPYVKDSTLIYNNVANDSENRQKAFLYSKAKNQLMKNIKLSASSSWMDDVDKNAIDNNVQTNWRANRLTWAKEKTYLTLDLEKEYNIGELIWVNGFGNSTPTKYSVEISIDNKNWQTVKEVKNDTRIDNKDLQIISFTPVNARYLKLNIIETLDTDAPQIGELWTIPSDYDNLDIKDTEDFLKNPLGYVASKDDFISTLKFLNNSGEVSVNGSLNNIIYDGLYHKYTFLLPEYGEPVSSLSITNLQIPGNLVLKNVQFKNQNLEEISIK